jgi:hypothetical protein
MRKNYNKKSDKVLSSYRKVGTKFVPPMLQTFKVDQISRASQTMRSYELHPLSFIHLAK